MAAISAFGYLDILSSAYSGSEYADLIFRLKKVNLSCASLYLEAPERC